MSKPTIIHKRKTEHLALCRTAEVEFRTRGPWFEHVGLVHQAVTGFSRGDVDLSTEFLGRRLRFPFLIGAMTGGTPEARGINRTLAEVAAEAGVGLALGSQRPMMEDPSLTDTFQVRDVAPDILLLGNIGLQQAMSVKPDRLVGLAAAIGADGLCLHLNAAMEMFQGEGDEPRRGANASIDRLAKALGDRLIVKETGCGISRETASGLAKLGVKALDVAGAGGTSWVRVENLRRGGVAPGMEAFEEWGIPTAASLLEVRGLRMRVIASGGLRSGIDLARALALGADLGSAALPVLRALDRGGKPAVLKWIRSLAEGLRTAMVLMGCRDLKSLRRAPLVLGGPLLDWAGQRGLWRNKP